MFVYGKNCWLMSHLFYKDILVGLGKLSVMFDMPVFCLCQSTFFFKKKKKKKKDI